MDRNQLVSKHPQDAERPFPWRCHHCGRHEVVITTLEYSAEVRHDGRLHQFMIPELKVPSCRACGEKVFTSDVDQQVNDALRAHLKLLTPAQIGDATAALGITQKDLAQRLGIAEATLSRWMTETQIQSRALDNLLRIFFAFPDVRDELCGELQDPALGAAVVSGAGIHV